MTELTPGMPAPDFELADATGKTRRLSDFRGRKVIVYFYPIDDTPGCTAQACDFRDAHEDLDKAGYVVLGISPQDAQSHAAFTAKYNLNFPLLVDDDYEVARRYGVWKDRGEYQGTPLLINRSTFVIDEDGVLVEALYGVAARGHVDALRGAIGV